jgi:hypothetical protein
MMNLLNVYSTIRSRIAERVNSASSKKDSQGRLYPECLFKVSVLGDEIVNERPDGITDRVSISEIRKVFVETNESGPWGMDVWWVLKGPEPAGCVSFPQGATGEDGVIARLSRLPGFEIRGMNSTKNARFECWPHPSD